MRQIFLILIAILGFTSISAQSVSCDELAEFIVENYDSKDEVKPLMSSMLVKVIRYQYEEKGFVIAYLKRNDYDFNGSPYIFCGISQDRWSNFKRKGLYGGSYGEAFHEYIIDYTCDCD